MKLTVAALLALALLAAPAAADQGRALLPTGIEMPVPEPDATGAQRAVALPDGGAVLVAWEARTAGSRGCGCAPTARSTPRSTRASGCLATRSRRPACCGAKPAGYVATFRDLAGATAGVAALP